jgi:hypothetical protein
VKKRKRETPRKTWLKAMEENAKTRAASRAYVAQSLLVVREKFTEFIVVLLFKNLVEKCSGKCDGTLFT